MTDLVTVINPENNQPIQIDSKNLAGALADGATYLPPVGKADLDGKGNAFIVTPDDHRTIAVPLNKVHGALADGGRLASTWDPNRIAMFSNPDNADLKKLGSLDKVQDADGNYILKNPSGQVLHLPQEQALPLLRNNYLTFNDSDFQALVDASRSDPGVLKSVGAGFRGIAAGMPVVGSLVDKLSGALESSTSYLPGKASDIASDINRARPETPEGRTFEAGQAVGTAGAVVGALAQPELGLMGEGLAASRLGAGAKALAATGELGAVQTAGLIGAAKGLGYSLPFVADQVINNQPKKAAETTLLSMGIGALLHAAPSAFNSVIGARSAQAAAELPNAAQDVLTQGGLNGDVMEAQQKVPFVRDLLTQASKPEEVGQGLKNLVAGDHMQPILSKLGAQVDTLPLISKLEELGYKTGASEGLNQALSGVIHSIEDVASNGEVSLENLQKAAKQIVGSINYNASVGEVTGMKILALDQITSTLNKAGDQALVNAVESGQDKVAKLAQAWEQAKNSQSIAQNLLSEFVDKTAKGVAPELTSLGQIAKNLFSQAGAGLQAKLQNPGTALLNLIPGVRTVSSASGAMAQATSQVIENRSASFTTWLASHPNPWLIKNAANPAIATFAALDAVAANNAKLAEIPGFLKDLGSKLPGIFSMPNDPISKLLGSESNGLSKEQQVQRLSDKVALLAGNPNLAQQRVNDLIQPFVTDHPQMALETQQTAQAKIAYIHQLLHSQASPQQAPLAFQEQQKFQMTPGQLKDVKAQLAAIENPFVLLSGLKTGTVTPGMVKAVQATSPAIFQEIQQAINNQAYTGKVSLTYQQRLSASMITGMPMDPTLQKTQMLQQTFAAPQPGPMAQAPEKKPRTAHKLDIEKLPSHQTAAQRISTS